MNLYLNRANLLTLTITRPLTGEPWELPVGDTVELRLFREQSIPLLTVTETPTTAGSVVTIGAIEREILGVNWPARSWVEVLIHQGDMVMNSGDCRYEVVVEESGVRHVADYGVVTIGKSSGV